MKAYLPLTEDSGSVLYDHSGNGYDADLMGGRLDVQGILGTSGVECSSGSEYVALPWAYDKTLSHPLTVNFWFKKNGVGNGGGDRVISHDASEYYHFMIHENSNGEMSFYGRESSSSGTRITGSDPVPVGEWHMWTGVIDVDQSEIRLYKNGELDVSASGSYTTWGSGTTRYGFLFDGSEASSYDGGRNSVWADGVLAEVRFYHRVLTDPEIQYLYEVGSQGWALTNSQTI